MAPGSLHAPEGSSTTDPIRSIPAVDTHLDSKSADANLVRLAPEILHQIASLIRENGDSITGSWRCRKGQRWTSSTSQADLAALSLTCRRLNTITAETLYYAPSATCHALLLRTLLERPDLASYVRALDEDDWPSSQHLVRDSNVALDRGLVKAVSERLSLNLDPSTFKISGATYYDSCQHDAIFDFLLALVAPNIEAVRCTGSAALSQAHQDHSGRVIESPLLGSGLVFPRLRFFAMSRASEVDGFELTLRKHFLDMCPNLESLWLDGCSSITKQLDVHNLRSLRMTNCRLSRLSLLKILASCHDLEDFCYAVRGQPHAIAGTGPSRVDAVIICRLLKPMAAASLRHLILFPGFFGDGSFVFYKGYQVELGGFPRLETLSIDASYYNYGLHGGGHADMEMAHHLSNSLPKNIRYLAMPSVRNGGQYAPVRHIAKAVCDGMFPRLEKVVFPHSKPVGFGQPLSFEEQCARGWVGGNAPGCKSTTNRERFDAAGVQLIKNWEDVPQDFYGLPTYDFIKGPHFLRANSSNDW